MNTNEIKTGTKILAYIFKKEEICTVIYVHVDGRRLDVQTEIGEKYGIEMGKVIRIIE
jgi:hypothetical protein